MKIAFVRPYYAANNIAVPVPFMQPTQIYVGHTREDLFDVHRLAGLNTGNFIHFEAIPRIFNFDAERSAVINLTRTANLRSVDWLADNVNENFDAVIFSTANFIQEKTAFADEAAFFGRLKIPFYLFGAGVQTESLADANALKPTLRRFLDIANANASLFATRGDYTSSILSDMGYKRTAPLGCPSFYAFPESFLRIRAPDKFAMSKVVTAGHLAAQRGPGERHMRLNNVLRTFPPDIAIEYVFQNELFWRDYEEDKDYFFDPSCMKVDSRWARHRFCQPQFDESLRIDSFRYFPDTASWRMFASTADMYFGDRIYGGVVCMQAGIPALVVSSDLRVQELTQRIGIPSIQQQELNGKTFDDIFDRYINAETIGRMHRTYRPALEEFHAATSKAGLVARKTPSTLDRQKIPAETQPTQRADGLTTPISVGAPMNCER